MKVRFFFLALMLGALAHGHIALAGPSAFSERLRAADEVRSTDPRRFAELIGSLTADRGHATPEELRHLRLLTNYRLALEGKYGDAISDSISLFDNAPEPELRYRAALLVANVAAVSRDYLLGLRYLEHALALQPEIRDSSLRELGHVVAGTLYTEFGHHDIALRHVDALLGHGPAARNRCIGQQIRIRALQKLGRTLEDTEVRKAVDDCTGQKEAIAASIIQATLAEYWAMRGKRQEAIALLESTLPAAEATGYTRLVGEIRSRLAEYQLALENTAVAKNHAASVIAMKGNDPRWPAVASAHHVLYEIALQQGDAAGALASYRSYAEADKARLDDIKAREYAFQLSRHELNQKNQSIALLSNQNQVLRLQQEVARRSAWNFRLAIALLAVIAASAAYWGWRARRMHRNLHQLANTDGLTGLANRRHFRERSEAVLRACEQRARPVSVLLFDLDHFKQINDQCGHSSGDWVLREVARMGRQHCREGDLYGRIGGEEFAMALVDCDIDAALRIAEQCRRSIEAIDAQQGTGCPLPVAASIGVVSTSISGYDYETLVAHADAAMYRSKVAGRNRVSLYQPPPVPEGGQVVALDGRNAAAMLREY